MRRGQAGEGSLPFSFLPSFYFPLSFLLFSDLHFFSVPFYVHFPTRFRFHVLSFLLAAPRGVLLTAAEFL